MQQLKPQGSLWKKGLTIVLSIAFGFALVCGALFASLYYLSSGEGFQHERVTKWLEFEGNSRLPKGLDVAVGEVRFKRDDEGLSLNAKNILLKTDEGKVFLNAPEVKFYFDLGAFSLENPYLKRIEVKGASALLIRHLDGKVSLQTGVDKIDLGDSNDENVILKLLGGLGSALNRVGLTEFKGVILRESKIQIIDEKTNITKDYTGFSLKLERKADNLMALLVADEEKGTALLEASAQRQANGNQQVAFNFFKMRLSQLKPILPATYNDKDLDFSLKGNAKIILNKEGQPLAMQSDLQIGEGVLQKHGKFPKTYNINESHVKLSWSEGRKEVNIDSLEYLMPPYHAKLSGIFSLTPDNNVNFFITQGAVDIYDPKGENPLTLNKIALKGSFNPQNMELNIPDAVIANPDLSLKINARLQFVGKTPGLYLGLESAKLTHPQFTRLWPEIVTPNLRLWILEKILAGTAENLIIKTAMPPDILAPDNVVLEPEMLLVKARVTKVVLRPLPDLGQVTAGEANIDVNGKRVQVETNKASLEVKNNRSLEANFALFEIADTGPEIPQATLRIKAGGEAKSLAGLLASETFKGLSAFDLDPESDIRGQAHAEFSLSMPLSTKLKRTDVSYKTEIDFKNFSQKDVVRDLDLENATIKVNATTKDFFLKGDGKIGGQQAHFEFKQPNKGQKPLINLQATLDEKGRARFGLASGGRIVGNTPVKISSVNDDSGVYNVEVDLTPPALHELIPGWNKGAGVAAKAKFKAIDLEEKGWRVEDIALDARGVNIKGSLEIDKTGQLVSGNFPNYNLHDGDRASVKIERVPNGQRVVFNATTIDLRPILKSLFASSAPVGSDKSAPKGLLLIEAKAAIAIGQNGEMMRNVTLKAQRQNGEIRYIEAKGRAGKGSFNIEMLKENKSNWITLNTSDAGGWLRFFDIYSSIQGGNMRIAIAPPKADGTISSGAFEVTDFAIKGDLAVSGIVASSDVKANDKNLSLAERQEILKAKARESDSQQFSQFSRMKAEFSRTANNVITINEGLIYGVAVGATVEGTLDFHRNRLALNGTYVPAYALNNIFAKLPIIGIFLGGGEEQGLLGVNYEIKGTPKKPELAINPLSLLAPGILRRMLDFKSHAAARLREGNNSQEFKPSGEGGN